MIMLFLFLCILIRFFGVGGWSERGGIMYYVGVVLENVFYICIISWYLF